MDGIDLIQDLAIVLLAAGVAGIICRRIGLSVIVGYLIAGILVGPYTPPFAFVIDVDRIQTLSQVGLVFLMFGIGLGLSLSKLGRMGWPTLLATGLGAILMLGLTRMLGPLVGWTGEQSLFIAAMFMVSSSAVIAKVIAELNLSHDRAGQLALSVTVLEDVVAVVMLTVLGSRAGTSSEDVGSVLAGLTAFVVLLVMAGLLMVPRMLRRLEARADPELQTIIVAGVLFMLALAAVKAGYSLALGAFLLGAIVAEIPQRAAVERSFGGMRDVFSSVFFVAIGMMIQVRLLLDVWPWIIGLGLFVLIARGIATTFALTVCGTPPRVARRAGLLLGPLGEFSFIIAQLGVSAAVLPEHFYPLSVGISIFTVLATPLINRFAEPILNLTERLEPRWLLRILDAYHGWLDQLQNSRPASLPWRLTRGRLVQVAVEVLFVTGVMTFSRHLLEVLVRNASAFGVEPQTLGYGFWGAISIIVLVPLVAIWRNVSAITMIFGESIGGIGAQAAVVQTGIKSIAAVVLGFWLFAIVPTEQLAPWGWIVIGLVAIIVVAVFSNRLIYWHSHWQSSVRDVLAEDPRGRRFALDHAARGRREQDLRRWNVHLRDCVVPDSASYGGQSLAHLAIPSRFGCAVLEVERNGIVITTVRPDLRLYPGDKLMLLGQENELEAACDFLAQERLAPDQSDEFRGSVLETLEVPVGPLAGRTLAELNVGQLTGTRIVGIQRGEQKIIAPSGQERLEAGDNVLVAGTLGELSAFRRWIKNALELNPA